MIRIISGLIFVLTFSTAIAEPIVEEIIVTGLRNTSTLEQTSASVTVFSKSQIRDASINRNTDFLSLTSGVNLVQGATITDSQLSIRGLYNARLTDSNVAIIKNGILIPNPGALNRELIDIESIEVIKGAQSALYGRNAIAGAIIINTVKPTADAFGGTSRYSFANNNARLLQQTINVPLTKNFAVKFTYGLTKTDGFYSSQYFKQKNVDDFNEKDLSLRFFGKVASNITLDLNYEANEANSGAVNFNSIPAGFSVGNCSVNNPTCVITTNVNSVNYRYLNNIKNINNSKNNNFSAKLDFDYGNDNSLTILLSNNKQDTSLIGDGTNGQATFTAANYAFNSVKSLIINGTNGTNGFAANLFSNQNLKNLLAPGVLFADISAAAAFLNQSIIDQQALRSTPGLNINTLVLENLYSAFGSNGQANYAKCLQSSLVSSRSLNPEQPYNYYNNYPSYGSTSCDGYQYQKRTQNDLNFELRYSSNPKQDIAWVAGFSLHNITNDAVASIGQDLGLSIIARELNLKTSTSPTEVLYSDTYNNKVAAVFGSLNLNVTENFNISFDARFDHEDKTVQNNVPTTSEPHPDYISNPDITKSQSETITCLTNFATNPLINPPCGIKYLNILYNFNGGKKVADVNKSFQQLQPKLALSYRPEGSGFNFYTSYSAGFRSGGFNFTGLKNTIDYYYCPSVTTLVTQFRPCNTVYDSNLNPLISIDPSKFSLQVYNVKDEYKKETSNTFELGFKQTLDNNGGFIDFSIYNNNVKNLQTFSYFAGAFGLLYGITNIDEASISGLEFSSSFVATESFTLGFGFSKIDSKIEKNKNRPYTVGNTVPFSPDSNANLFLQYKGQVSNKLVLLFRIDYSYTGTTWFSEVQGESVNNIYTKYTGLCYSSADLANLGLGMQVNPSNCNQVSGLPNAKSDLRKTKRDPFGIINLRLDLISDDSLRFGIWGKNIENIRYPVEVIAAPEAGQAFVLQSGGVSYGFEISAKY